MRLLTHPSPLFEPTLEWRDKMRKRSGRIALIVASSLALTPASTFGQGGNLGLADSVFPPPYGYNRLENEGFLGCGEFLFWQVHGSTQDAAGTVLPRNKPEEVVIAIVVTAYDGTCGIFVEELASVNIPCTLGGAPFGVEVRVPKKEEAKAREIIDSSKRLRSYRESSATCREERGPEPIPASEDRTWFLTPTRK